MQINKYIRSYPKRKECSLIQKKLPERMDFKGKWKLKSQPWLWTPLKAPDALCCKVYHLRALLFGKQPHSVPHSKVGTAPTRAFFIIKSFKKQKDNILIKTQSFIKRGRLQHWRSQSYRLGLVNIKGKETKPDDKSTQKHKSTDTWKVLKWHWFARCYQWFLKIFSPQKTSFSYSFQV